MDQEFFDRWAHYLNPKMQVIALKLPPRKGKDEIACVWEFRVEE
jgi:surfactin synthase thioesterase subunit